MRKNSVHRKYTNLFNGIRWKNVAKDLWTDNG